ncbi:hypothetical protein [Sporomusa malonica]|uniref:Uncharacterized protein n=1 Tax=Sporomusa malonica TaxID=112901 RepID=A0A1W2AUI3_9FIRM|nr:hypothetical protein [Sporomusa malonica]SMC64387.1 hypothetical protein SAMN04488500_106136 [Sporomusa malonica]
MIIPETFTEFQSEGEYNKFISIFDFSKKNIASNRFAYKGYYSDKDLACSIVGHTASQTLVIKFQDTEQLHCINGFYLKDMQKTDFNAKEINNI